MIGTPEQASQRTSLYHLITLLMLIPATGFPLFFGFGLALTMPTWLAPPDTNIWNTINLYVIACELLWLIPTILVLRFRKFNLRKLRKRYIIMIVPFIVFWGLVIVGSLYDNTSVLLFNMMNESTICELHSSNNHVYYECYGYFSDYPPPRPNQPHDWRAIFEGSSTVPLVKVPCRIGWCN